MTKSPLFHQSVCSPLYRRFYSAANETGLAEDKLDAAKELMLKLTDVKRMCGRKEVDFDRVCAETKDRADAGCFLSKVCLLKCLQKDMPDGQTNPLSSVSWA